MRVLLDECLPRKLKPELPGHDVLTAPELGWARLATLLQFMPEIRRTLVTLRSG